MAECLICLEDFDQTEHNPFSLPCGHLFCASCIHKVMGPEVARCPGCESVFPLLYDVQPSVRKVFWSSSPDRPATQEDATAQLSRLKESNRELLEQISRLQSQIANMDRLKTDLLNKTAEAKGLSLEVQDLKRCISTGRSRTQFLAGPSTVRQPVHQVPSPPPPPPILHQPNAPAQTFYNPFEDPESQRTSSSGPGPMRRSVGADVSGGRYDPYRGSASRISSRRPPAPPLPSAPHSVPYAPVPNSLSQIPLTSIASSQPYHPTHSRMIPRPPSHSNSSSNTPPPQMNLNPVIPSRSDPISVQQQIQQRPFPMMDNMLHRQAMYPSQQPHSSSPFQQPHTPLLTMPNGYMSYAT